MIIVTPTTSCEGWPVRDWTGEQRYGISDGDTTLETMEYVWMANFLGMPSLVVPAGFVEGVGDEGKGVESVPVGVMGMGEWGAEEELLGWGLDVEALSGDVVKRPPIWVDVVERAKREMSGNGGTEGEVLIDV